MTLREMKVGEKARVKKVKRAGPVGRRIADMGVVPGAELVVERVAPLGDPIEIRVRGYHLSLRREEADQIEVEPVRT